MRNMSFALTTEQIFNRTKTVTRRVGWTFLKPGDLLCAVRKGQGMKKGEKVERLATLRVVSVRRESLDRMILDLKYGLAETCKEGFPNGPFVFPRAFVEWFCEGHNCKLDDDVTRIEFKYVDGERA